MIRDPRDDLYVIDFWGGASWKSEDLIVMIDIARIVFNLNINRKSWYLIYIYILTKFESQKSFDFELIIAI